MTLETLRLRLSAIHAKRIKTLKSALTCAFALALVIFIPTPAKASLHAPSRVHLSWQRDPSTSVTVTWQTDPGLSGYLPMVEYGLAPGSYTQQVMGSSHSWPGASVDVHQVELTSLIPDTTYFYRCGDAIYGWSGENAFHTAPQGDSSFTFGVFGDSRDDWSPLYDNNDFSITADIARFVKEERPLFSIFTGDFVLDGNSEQRWNSCLSAMEPLISESVMMSCHGNHEQYAQAYFQRFAFPDNERWYSFDVSNAHFVCLDTGLRDDREQELISQQALWLQEDLQSALTRGCDWIVIFLHRPPYASGGHGNQEDVISGFVPIFDQYGVDCVFAGHNHYYERSRPMRGSMPVAPASDYYLNPQGTVYVTTGGAGAPLSQLGSANWVASSCQDYHYLNVQVLGDKALRVTAKSRDGLSLDQFTISRTSEPLLASINPPQGWESDEVVITGNNFGSDKGASFVSFGSIVATEYAYWSEKLIRCKIPELGTGAVQVKVNTPAGGSNPLDFLAQPSLYLAEGYTGFGFQGYLCVFNPDNQDVEARIIYHYSDRSSKGIGLNVPANCRITVNLNSSAGPGREMSIHLQSNSRALVVERPMYFRYTGGGSDWTGGSDVLAATHPSLTWYFAEGYTGKNFHQWVVVYNPCQFAARLTFRFQTREAGEIVRSGQIARAGSRTTFYINKLLGEGYSNSLKLESDLPVIAERPVYFEYRISNGIVSNGGHCVMGAPSLGSEYYFAEGTTRDGFDQYICLQNPHGEEIIVEAEYHLGKNQGAPAQRSYTLKPGTRRTIFVPAEVGRGKDVSVRLFSASTFLAERPVYFHYQIYGSGCAGGHCVVGTFSPGKDWRFAEGYTGTGFDEWLCLYNPGDQPAAASIFYLAQEKGALPVRQITIPAKTRATVFVNISAGYGLTLSSRIRCDQPIVSERPIYFRMGSGWNGGHDIIGHKAE